jgi:hypothetical protein
MPLSTDTADVLHTGAHTFRGPVTVPNNTILKEAIKSAAGVEATKLEHQHRIPYSQPNTTATTETRVLYVCYAATARVIDFRAGSIVACIGAATITLDVKKNGTTILSSVLTLNNANTARVAVAATLSGTPALVTGDVLEVVVTATAGGGTIGTGLFASLTVEEDAR